MKRSLFVLGSVLALSACGSSSSDSGTTGKRIALEVKIQATPESLQPFTNGLGWQITLTKAMIATGPLYYYDGATIFSMHAPAPRGPLDRFTDFFVKSAYAHPGHYIPGNAKGEFLSPSSADLRAGVTSLGFGNGVTGDVRSATFSFSSPAQGPAAGILGSNVAIVEGTATMGAETSIFTAHVTAAEIDNTKNQPEVEGCPFAETNMTTDGTVTISVKLPQWFDQVDFALEPKSTDGKPVELPADGVARNGLDRGFKAGLTYTFAYAAK